MSHYTKLAKEWVNSLRSGKFNQTTGTLKSKLPDGSVGHCCIGVFVQEQLGFGIKTQPVDPNSEGSPVHYNRFDKFIERIPSISKYTLISMNDGGNTFDEIADYIEEQLGEV